MSKSDDQMAPEASPGSLLKKLGVRRVNNIPMYLLGIVLVGFAMVMGMVAMDRASKRNKPAEETHKDRSGNASVFAKEIVGSRTGGMVDPVLIAKPTDLEHPPIPPGGQLTNPGLNGPAQDDETSRIRLAKLQMLEEAVKSKPSVQMVALRGSAAAHGDRDGAARASPETQDETLARIAEVQQQIDSQRETDLSGAFKARLARLQGTEIDNGGSVGATGASSAELLQVPPTTNGGRNNMGQFNNHGGERWKMNTKVEPPQSPYELRTGFVVPATLISGINSELPGQIMAQVAQNVYDTATGKYLLIPLGSRLFGAYSSDVIYGQARVLVAWQRIIFPDGKALDIGAMPGADSAGYAGFNDQVNNHYLRLFVSAILMSGITAGITYSQNRWAGTGVYGAPTAASVLSESLGQQLGQVAAQLIAKNMNIAPTLEIRPGYRFNVIVTKDMVFSRPYRSFDY